MILDNRANNGEPHAHSTRLRSEKGLEQTSHDRRVDALARITDRYAYFVGLRLRCAEGPAETIRVDVEHDGAPLGSKARSRVFEPFFSTKPGRLGLGLNIARRIAGRWGGTVEIQGGPARGVVSTLSLPQSPQRSSEF